MKNLKFAKVMSWMDMLPNVYKATKWDILEAIAVYLTEGVEVFKKGSAVEQGFNVIRPEIDAYLEKVARNRSNISNRWNSSKNEDSEESCRNTKNYHFGNTKNGGFRNTKNCDFRNTKFLQSRNTKSAKSRNTTFETIDSESDDYDFEFYGFRNTKFLQSRNTKSAKSRNTKTTKFRNTKSAKSRNTTLINFDSVDASKNSDFDALKLFVSSSESDNKVEFHPPLMYDGSAEPDSLAQAHAVTVDLSRNLLDVYISFPKKERYIHQGRHTVGSTVTDLITTKVNDFSTTSSNNNNINNNILYTRASAGEKTPVPEVMQGENGAVLRPPLFDKRPKTETEGRSRSAEGRELPSSFTKQGNGPRDGVAVLSPEEDCPESTDAVVVAKSESKTVSAQESNKSKGVKISLTEEQSEQLYKGCREPLRPLIDWMTNGDVGYFERFEMPHPVEIEAYLSERAGYAKTWSPSMMGCFYQFFYYGQEKGWSWHKQYKLDWRCYVERWGNRRTPKTYCPYPETQAYHEVDNDPSDVDMTDWYSLGGRKVNGMPYALFRQTCCELGWNGEYRFVLDRHYYDRDDIEVERQSYYEWFLYYLEHPEYKFVDDVIAEMRFRQLDEELWNKCSEQGVSTIEDLEGIDWSVTPRYRDYTEVFKARQKELAKIRMARLSNERSMHNSESGNGQILEF